MTDGFDLRSLIREVCEEQDGELATEKIVQLVIERVDKSDLAMALEQSLYPMVHLILTRRRRGTTIQADNASTAEGSEEADVVRLAGRPSRSAKVAGIRKAGEAWRRSLEERYTIANGVTAPLGDLTRDQLLLNIRIREEQARRCAAKALQLRGLLDLVDRHGVARVRELPESVLAAILTRSAA